MTPEADKPADFDVAFYGSSGEYLVFVQTRSRRAGAWATDVLREHGAAMQQAQLPEWLPDPRDESTHSVTQSGREPSAEGVLIAEWASLAAVFLERGLVAPADLLALVVASAGRSDTLPPKERQQRLKLADAELREVSERLESLLQARHPDLFDRRGRLRTTLLSERIAERTGGVKTLSDADLSSLEETESETARAGRAP
jgi:hypothetical protein